MHIWKVSECTKTIHEELDKLSVTDDEKWYTALLPHSVVLRKKETSCFVIQMFQRCNFTY